MLTVRTKFSRIHLNNRKYLRDTERAINKVIKEAAREFLIAVLNSISGADHTVEGGSFPVQTGEAAGSLLPLAAALGQAQQGVSFGITPAIDSRYKDGRLRPNRISVGRSQGHVSLGPTGRKLTYGFSFSSDVLHFYVNDIIGSNIPKSVTPWKSMAIGYKAFERYIDTHMFNRIPKLDDYFYTSEQD